MKNAWRGCGCAAALAALAFPVSVIAEEAKAPGDARPEAGIAGAEDGASELPPGDRAIAHADIKDKDGNDIGQVRLTETPQGVILRVRMSTAEEGTHGFHVHEKGLCDPSTGFESAGGHFNPTGHAHGFASADGLHAGDLPNIEIGDTSNLELTYFLPGVTLDDGKMGLLDEDGAALVLHASGDDYESQPSGDSGNRIACGAIEPGAETGAEPEPRAQLR